MNGQTSRRANGPISLEDGTCGRRAVLHSVWSDQFITYLLENGVVELELNQAKGWLGQNLTFLDKVPWLEAFRIADFTIRDIGPIHYLHNLRLLNVTTYCSTEIEFAAFPKLETCRLEWRPKATSVFSCVTLKDFFVNRYKGNDTAPFAQLVNLESLAILNAPVKNLLGLRDLIRLRSLRLANLISKI